jgi:hypothetical protein
MMRDRQFFGFGSKPEEVLSTSPPSSPPPVPFVVDEGRVAIVVECLDQKFQRTIRTGEDATLNDILAQLVKKNPFPVRLLCVCRVCRVVCVVCGVCRVVI